MSSPKITIITVVYNARPTLEATILSVLNQEEELFEYIIIDGGSTDGSVELIRKYERRLANWCSEPDNGIYDAMNKGIDRSRGEWIYFLGGDDTLRPNILSQVASYLNTQYAIVFGDIMFDNGYQYRSFLGPRTVLQNTVHHQSAFYASTLFTNYRYDETLTIVAEYDVHLRLYSQNIPTLRVPLIIADCATGGASSELPRSLIETNRVRERYVKSKWKNRFLSAFLSLYYAQKTLRFKLYGHRV